MTDRQRYTGRTAAGASVTLSSKRQLTHVLATPDGQVVERLATLTAAQRGLTAAQRNAADMGYRSTLEIVSVRAAS